MRLPSGLRPMHSVACNGWSSALIAGFQPVGGNGMMNGS